jgi:hypothetical protein
MHEQDREHIKNRINIVRSGSHKYAGEYGDTLRNHADAIENELNLIDRLRRKAEGYHGKTKESLLNTIKTMESDLQKGNTP